MHLTLRKYCPCRCRCASNGLRVVQLGCPGKQMHMRTAGEIYLQQNSGSGGTVCVLSQAVGQTSISVVCMYQPSNGDLKSRQAYAGMGGNWHMCTELLD